MKELFFFSHPAYMKGILLNAELTFLANQARFKNSLLEIRLQSSSIRTTRSFNLKTYVMTTISNLT